MIRQYLRFVPLTAVLALAGAGGQAADTKTVVIENLQFRPATLTVRPGDTIVWKNADIFPHTATAPGGFDSKEIAPNTTWTFTPTRTGKFPYVCTLHPTMKGTLVVK